MITRATKIARTIEAITTTTEYVPIPGIETVARAAPPTTVEEKVSTAVVIEFT